MKRNDPNFKEQFIILHDNEGEIIVRKKDIFAVAILKEEGDIDENTTYRAAICIGSILRMLPVKESVDEILELL